MNKTTLKIFLSFSFVAAVIATLLLIINALGLGILASDTDFFFFVNYLRRLEDKPECSYEDVYRFYDERKRAYIEQYGDPTGIFADDPTEVNRPQIERFIIVPKDSMADNESSEVVLGGD